MLGSGWRWRSAVWLPISTRLLTCPHPVHRASRAWDVCWEGVKASVSPLYVSPALDALWNLACFVIQAGYRWGWHPGLVSSSSRLMYRAEIQALP